MNDNSGTPGTPAAMVRKKSKKDFVLMAPYMMLQTGTWRYPFLMLDRITDIKLDSRCRIVATRNVCSNEPQFQGHFTNVPVMPGVLIAEAFGQASEYLSFFIDFVRRYREIHSVDLSKDREELQKALHTPKGLEVVTELRTNTFGFLASQDIKYRDAVGPGDILEITSERTVFDKGFSHFNVEARVKNKVVSSGRISNWRGTRGNSDEAMDIARILAGQS